MIVLVRKNFWIRKKYLGLEKFVYKYNLVFMCYADKHLEYCVQAWSPYSEADKNKLEQVQKRAVNMVAGLRGRTYEEKLREVGLTTLHDRRVRGDMIQTFKILNHVDQVNTNTWFSRAGERDREGATNTRHSMDTTQLVEGQSRTQIRRSFFSQRVPRQWNTLSQTTRQQTSVLNFKAAYDGTRLREPG